MHYFSNKFSKIAKRWGLTSKNRHMTFKRSVGTVLCGMYVFSTNQGILKFFKKF